MRPSYLVLFVFAAGATSIAPRTARAQEIVPIPTGSGAGSLSGTSPASQPTTILASAGVETPPHALVGTEPPASQPAPESVGEESGESTDEEELEELEPSTPPPRVADQSSAASAGRAAEQSIGGDLNGLRANTVPFTTPLSEPEVVETTIDSRWVGEQHLVVLLPPGYSATAAPYPVVIAMHGYAESLGSNLDGARAWVDTYDLAHAESALAGGHLVASDFGGLVTKDRLDAYNDMLASDPYRGVIVACVYTPDVWGGSGLDDFDSYVSQEVVGYLKATYRASSNRADWSIDGVSLGGHHALYIGLRHPDVFGVIGAMQPAISGDMDSFVTEAAANSSDDDQRIHLVTSDSDAYLLTTLNYAAYLKRSHCDGVDLSVLPGPHGYEFNQGPGAVEMLFYQDRVGRGLEPVASDPISTKIHSIPVHHRRRHHHSSSSSSTPPKKKKKKK